jgi:hypothetical protein
MQMKLVEGAALADKDAALMRINTPASSSGAKRDESRSLRRIVRFLFLPGRAAPSVDGNT